jgi:hypothetical protein
MGISSLPTAARRDNEESGIAIGRIHNSEALGSYHKEYSRKLKEMDIQPKLAIAESRPRPRTRASRWRLSKSSSSSSNAQAHEAGMEAIDQD